MEPCDPSAEEVLIEEEDRKVLNAFLSKLKQDYSDWEDRLNDSSRERYEQWIVNIRCDILAGKYGKDIRQYMEDIWLHRKRLFKTL